MGPLAKRLRVHPLTEPLDILQKKSDWERLVSYCKSEKHLAMKQGV